MHVNPLAVIWYDYHFCIDKHLAPLPINAFKPKIFIWRPSTMEEYFIPHSSMSRKASRVTGMTADRGLPFLPGSSHKSTPCTHAVPSCTGKHIIRRYHYLSFTGGTKFWRKVGVNFSGPTSQVVLESIAVPMPESAPTPWEWWDIHGTFLVFLRLF